MFTQLEPREIVTEGVLETNAFTIKANGKAFKVLIDGLYSDKVRSIVRELWSNAFDSHIAAGRADMPFDCQLPTVWEPFFRVRDYGTSLPHADVMHLYTTVFESTKEDTNAQVGKLGLGSKSPFAYTDTFTVTTWRDGIKRVYSAYIGADSVPMIALLGEERSDEPQGLEVAFPVKSSDIDTFERAANRVALGFDVKPNTFDVTLRPPVSEALYSGPGWKLCDSDESMSALAKQGCVVYPIDPLAVTGATSQQIAFLRAPLFIDFDIGQLEIAASREGLGYNEETCRNILAAVDRIAGELFQQLRVQFDNIETYWEACELYSKLTTGASMPKPALLCLEKMRFRGRELATKWYIDNPNVRKIDAYVANGRRRRNTGGWEGQTGFYASPRDCLVYFQDATQNITCIKERLKHHYSTVDESKHLIIVRGVPGSMVLKRAWVKLGRPPEFFNLADLPRPPREKKEKRKEIRVRRYAGFSSDPWVEADIDPANGGIYTCMLKGDAVRYVGEATRHIYNNHIETTVQALIALGVIAKGTTVYGIPATLKNIPKRHKNWRCIWDIAQEAFDAGFNAAGVRRHKEVTAYLDQFHRQDIGGLCRTWHDNVMAPDFEGPAYRLLLDYSTIAAEASMLQAHTHYSKLALVLRVAIPDEDDDTDGDAAPALDLSQHGAAVLAAYPMIQMALDSYINDDRAKTVLDYVNLIDSRDSSNNTPSIEEAA
jgi:hypothetical protein